MYHFTKNYILSVAIASLLYLVMSVVVLIIFSKKQNRSFKVIMSNQIEYLFKDHWIKKLVLSIVSIVFAIVLAFIVHPDALQTVAIATIIGVVFLSVYFLFNKKDVVNNNVTISDEIILKRQKMIKEDKVHDKK